MIATRLFNDLVDLCFPGICTLCQQSAEPGAPLCSGCNDQLTALERGAACWKCAAPIASFDSPCPFCQGKGVPHYSLILRLGVFEEPLDQLVKQLKYSGRWNVGETLAARLYARSHVKQLLEDCDVIVPVPLHFFRQFQRGYNQAAVVAKALGKLSRKPVVSPLTRVRNTESQTHLHGRRNRFKNLKGAFRLRRANSIAGKRVVVVDDVTTTGATLQIVARTLAPARPADVAAIVLAVADPRGRQFSIV